MRTPVIVLAGALLVGACSSNTSTSRPAPQTSSTASSSGSSNSRQTLGIPPGQLPRQGLCRVWVPGTPPGRQARARSCAGILETAPAGSWILYRPTRERSSVRVRVVDDSRAGVITVVRVYDVGSGNLIREMRPADDRDDDDDDRGRGRGRRERP